MSDKKPTAAGGVLVGRDFWDVPVRIRSRAYFNFGRRMDSQLRRLVKRWSRTAAPVARGVSHDKDQLDTSRPGIARPSPLTEENAPWDEPWNRRPDSR